MGVQQSAVNPCLGDECHSSATASVAVMERDGPLNLVILRKHPAG